MSKLVSHPLLPKDPNVRIGLAKLLLEVRIGLSGAHYGTYKTIEVSQNPIDRRPLAVLVQQDIADVFGFPGTKTAQVTVYNRYRFECLLTDIYTATGYEELKKHAETDRSPNIVVYDPASGVGFINGKKINFTRKQSKINKKLFDALFLAGSNAVTEAKLKSIVGMPGRNGTAVVLEINSAITNLRKICGVDSQVIQHKGYAKLDALTFRPDPGLVKKLLQR